MSSVNIYRIFCIEENIFVTLPSFEEPILCPNNHSNRTIDPNKTSIVNIADNNSMVIEEPTSGVFQAESIPIDIPETQPGQLVTIDLSWPMEILIWKLDFMPIPEMANDVISVVIDPDRKIGNLTQNGTDGDTILHVSTDTFATIMRGFDIDVYDGVKRNNVERVSEINETSETITVSKPIADNFYVSGNNVEIQYQNRIIRKCVVPNSSNSVSFGDKGFKGKKLPANTINRIEYVNNNGLPKKWNWNVQYYIIG